MPAIDRSLVLLPVPALGSLVEHWEALSDGPLAHNLEQPGIMAAATCAESHCAEAVRLRDNHLANRSLF